MQDALLSIASSRVGQVAADIGERIRRGRTVCINCQVKGEEMKGRGKEKRERGEVISLACGR